MGKTVIFANGMPTIDLAKNRPLIAPAIDHIINPATTIICADGGTLHALTLGLTPDLIVGDLDSLPADVQDEMTALGVEIQRHPVKKDQTDLELALSLAIARGATEIVLLTALGGRLDQQLANIFLLTRPEWAPARLGLAEGNQIAWLLRGPDALTLTGQPGDTLSIVPLSPTVEGLHLENVEWPLQNTTVSFGSTLTISNTFIKTQVRIEIKTGLALVIQIKQNKQKVNPKSKTHNPKSLEVFL